MLVLTMTGSMNKRTDGSTMRTVAIEIIAPRAISRQSDEIMLILEYRPTPNVAAKNENAETMILVNDVLWAIMTASPFVFPAARSVW